LGELGRSGRIAWAGAPVGGERPEAANCLAKTGLTEAKGIG